MDNQEKALPAAIEHHDGAAGAHQAAGKGQATKQVRKWLSISTEGVASALELSKIRVTHQLGIQLRDLRLLDPHLATSYPSAILARDRALIVNLEFIKMIIGLDRCFITHLEDPNTALFVEELQRRLQLPASSAAAMGVSPSTAALSAQLQPQLHLHIPPSSNPGNTTTSNTTTSPFYSQYHPEHATEETAPLTGNTNQTPLPPSGIPPSTHNNNNGHAAQPSVKTAPPHPPLSILHPATAPFIPPAELPFELRVLECALDVVSRFLEQQTSDLEAAAHPALDALTKKITTSNLERVRRIKNRMVRLTTRVETLKELLEKLLDDDSDMKDLNLTAKEVERFEVMHRQSMRSTGTPFDVPLPSSGTSAFLTGGSSGLFTPHTPKSPGSVSSSSSLDEEEVEIVEQLLESYFMILDNTWNKLQTLTEYIDDTEDFINIELDSHRNQLIRLDLVLTSFTASMGLITAITGLFAMNVTLSPKYEDKAPYSWFVTIACSSGVVAIIMFSLVMFYCRWKRLI